MALKNLQSNYDLVPGTGPVENMEIQQGPQFDLGPSSILQVNSLPQLPLGSSFQDLNGEQGPSFNNGSDSTLQQDSLLQQYNYSHGGESGQGGPVPNNSQYQDLNGQQGPSFNNGPEIQGPNLIDTLHENSLLFNYSYQQGNSIGFAPNSVLDLNGGIDLNFYTMGGTVNAPFQGPTTEGHLVDLLTSNVYSTNTGQTYNPSLNQDLNGGIGPSFNNGPEFSGPNLIDTLHEQSLTSNYSYQHGNSIANINPTTLDLDGGPGQSFDNGPEPYSTPNVIDSFHESALVSLYQSAVSPEASYGAGQPGSPWPVISNTSLAGPEPLNNTQFDNGMGDGINSLHTDLLGNIYNSSINAGASYNSNWPNVPSGIHDLNGNTPTGYVNPDTGNTF